MPLLRQTAQWQRPVTVATILRLNGMMAMINSNGFGKPMDGNKRWRWLARGAALGMALLVASPVIAAEDDDDDGTADMSFEQRMIHQLMSGIGATNGYNNKGIDYRERSPLVIPPSTNLPAPDSAVAAPLPNWPKDPEIKKRREAKAARKQAGKSIEEEGRPMTPSELAAGRSTRSSSRDSIQPGGTGEGVGRLSLEELGYKGGVFNTLWGYTKKDESVAFTGEPTRETLTQPPPGYQTPSSKHVYGSNATADPTKDVALEGKPLAPGKF
jgi:hypothetical protein